MFKLGVKDRRELFCLPDQVVGRKEEIDKLKAAAQSLCVEEPIKYIMLHGWSGIGKTSLIRCLIPGIVMYRKT